mgnify:FL=1
MAEFSDQKIAHLGLIQNVIDRMAGESARMKQFGLVTIGALGSVAEATASWPLALVAVVITAVFWGLDANYLAQERRYRDLYDRVRASDGPADFAMTPDAETRARHGVAATLLGWSNLPLYGTLLVLAVLLTVAVAAAG